MKKLLLFALIVVMLLMLFQTTVLAAVTSVSISGTLKVGEVLTANVIGDTDAFTTYHWNITNDAAGAVHFKTITIMGLNTYTIEADCVGKYIRVTVDGVLTSPIVGPIAAADTTAPTVSSVTPTGTGVALTGSIVIIFSEPMNTTTGTVTLNPTGGTLSSGSWNSPTNTVYTIPYSGLTNSTSYTVNIADFEDIASNIMLADTKTFTTAAKPFSDGGGTSSPNLSFTYNIYNWSGNSNGIAMKCNGEYADFTELYIDGDLLRKGTDYTVKSGSTIFTIKASYLKKLSNGDHTVTAYYTNGYGQTTLTINGNPKTGDESNVVLWGLIAVLAMGTLILVLPKKKRIK